MPFMREVRVIITNKDDPEKKVVFENHRIEFEVRSTIGWPADTANVTLYNLALDEVKFLQDKNFGNWYIEIQAGYADASQVVKSNLGAVQVTSNTRETTGKGPKHLMESDTIFSGLITNCIGYRRPPEHVTQLFCISKVSAGATKFQKMRSIPKGATLKEALISMCQDYGFSKVTQYGLDESDISEVLPRGRVFHDTFMVEFKRLLSEFNMNFTMTTNEIQIFPNTYGRKDAIDRMAKDRIPLHLDANQIIGNPIAGIITLNLTTFLSAAIQPGVVLDASKLLGKAVLANGVVSVEGGIELNTDDTVFKYSIDEYYQVMEVVHRGDTHGMPFSTTLSAVIGGASAMGLKETSWADMYASTGMAEGGTP